MAKKRVGKFPKAFRQMAVDWLNHCENIVALAKELGISRRLDACPIARLAKLPNQVAYLKFIKRTRPSRDDHPTH